MTDIQRDDKGHFLPGQSGHPEGRPPDSVSLVTVLKRILRENPKDGEAIIQSLIKEGKTGNLGAQKELLDRIDGKVAERHIIEEIPIKLIFVPADQIETRKELPSATE